MNASSPEPTKDEDEETDLMPADFLPDGLAEWLQEHQAPPDSKAVWEAVEKAARVVLADYERACEVLKRRGHTPQAEALIQALLCLDRMRDRQELG